MSLDVTCRCVYVLVSGWALNEEIGLEIRTKMVCGIKTKYIGRKEKINMWSQCRKGRSVLAVLLRGCVPAVLFVDLNQGFVGLLCSGKIVLVFIGSKLHSGFSFD